jgi:hypothetical protein
MLLFKTNAGVKVAVHPVYMYHSLVHTKDGGANRKKTPLYCIIV